MRVTLQTEVQTGCVYYAVYRDDERIWSVRVPFGSKASNRAGGYAFRAAAEEQERRARECWDAAEYNVLGG